MLDNQSKIETIQTFDDIAQQYLEKYKDYGPYVSTYDKLCKLIEKKDARVLEIGCGPGNMSHYLMKTFPKLTLLGIDLAPTMIELAQKTNPTALFKVMDSRDILSLKQQFDVVTCGFIAPYLTQTETVKLIQDLSQLLPIHGKVYFSTMEAERYFSEYQTTRDGKRVYVHYHEYRWIEEAFKTSGFEILEVERKMFKKRDGTSLTDLFIYANHKGEYF